MDGFIRVDPITIKVGEDFIQVPGYDVGIKSIIDIMELAAHWPTFDLGTRNFAREVAEFFQAVKRDRNCGRKSVEA
jgi:hypothetical protein